LDQELVAYLERRFGGLDQRLDTVDQRLDRLEGDVRHAHVLLESLQGTSRLVAEGLMGFGEQLERHRAEIDRKLGDLHAAIAPAYRNLEEKVDRQTTELNRRLIVLEERADREHRDVIAVIREKFGLRQA